MGLLKRLFGTKPSPCDLGFEFELVPLSMKNPTGHGYYVRRCEDGQQLQWRTLPSCFKSFNVIGIRHRSLEAINAQCFSPGCPLTLVPEPENPYDPNAIAVWDKDKTLNIGYVPSDETADIHDWMTYHHPFYCLSIWEVIPSGTRTALRALLIESDTSVYLPWVHSR